MERLYTSPTYGMWYPIDDKSLSSNLPPMVVFPESSEFYEKWRQTLLQRDVKVCSQTSFVTLPVALLFPSTTLAFYIYQDALLTFELAQVRLNTELDAIHSRSPKVRVSLRPRRQEEDFHNTVAADHDLPSNIEEYDEIVLCVLADTAKRILGKEGRAIEKFVLGNTKWSDDITVTHSVCPSMW